MVKCPKCNQSIIYCCLNTSDKKNDIIMLDAKIITIVTPKGREVKGRTYHQCKG